MSHLQRELELNGRKITLVGTAHVSAESIKEVETTIKELTPDCVAIELDDKRADSIENKDKYRDLDIVKVIKNNEGFLLMANLVLSSFQRRMGSKVGVQPGDEMLAAMNVAKEMNIPTVMADRPIQTTLRRAWAKNSLWGKCKLLASLISSAFSKEEFSEEDIEQIKEKNEMDSMMQELSEYMPVIKQVLIDERDEYLATKIWNAQGNNIVAVLGAGHLNGVEEHLKQFASGQKQSNIQEISQIPPKTIWGRIWEWIIPVSIIGLIAFGFIYGGVKAGSAMLTSWFLWTGLPAVIGTILAGGHPVTILAAFVTAPFTTLSPFVGVGFVSGIVQACICKPKVSDIETVQDDICHIKTFYKNRLLRVLLVFFIPSLLTSIGTFIGLADIIKQGTNIK